MAGIITPSSFSAFGDLLRYLRRRAQLTQQELGIAVGYSEAHIARLERGRRLPDPAMVQAQFIPALHLDSEPELAARLVRLAEMAHGLPAAQAGTPPALVRPPVPVTRPTNLPAQITRFIGREMDIAEVQRLIIANRLVTLTGPGGMGKTRLALEIGASFLGLMHSPGIATSSRPVDDAQLLQTFPDGVWLVELAPVTDPKRVPHAVAEVLKVPSELGRDLVDVIIGRLEHEHLLLILDGCEHLVTASADLAERLLIFCPDLHILVTSREALRIPGEVNWRVPPFSTPDPGIPSSLEHALDYEAVQLFIEHASAVQPEFTLTPEGLAAIVQICYRLDGIPLAIEMAAAQTASMSPQEIAAHLDDRFALLSNGRRTALPRQRTLRATIEWSYQLLSVPERDLLDSLSVFVNGFTADAAQAVGIANADPGSPGPDQEALDGSRTVDMPDGATQATSILPLLVELVNKSLVVAHTHGGGIQTGQTRYHILETIRQFAAEKLAAKGQTNAAYERMAGYLISLALVRANGGDGPPKAAWLNQLQAEVDNIRALMTWARSLPDDARMSLTLSTALSALWVSRGYLSEASAWLEEALARGVAAPPALRAEALNGLLRLLVFRGYNLSRWRAYADETCELAERIDDPTEQFESYYWAGYAAMHRADYANAGALFERAYTLAQRHEYSHGNVIGLCALGWVRLKQDDPAGATSFFQRSLSLAQEAVRQPKHVLGAASQFDACSVISSLSLTDLPAAMLACEQDVARLRVSPHSENFALTLQVYAELLLMRGDYPDAKVRLTEALARWQDLGVEWNLGNGMARTMLDLGQLAWLCDDPTTAAGWYQQSLQLCRHAGDRERVARLHVLIGYTLLARGDLKGAAESIGRGLRRYHEELEQPAGIALALGAWAALEMARGQEERAARLFGAAAVQRDVLLAQVISPANSVIQDREMQGARARFEGTPLASAWAEGERMTLEEAVRFARE